MGSTLRSIRIGGLMISVFALWLAAVACAAGGNGKRTAPPADEDPEAERRREMVTSQIESRGVRNPRVLEAMRAVPRHRFVPVEHRAHSYSDGPLSIGSGQTISQPYIVALMTELIGPDRPMKVLEVGTGSGYQAAVLAEVVGEVFTIEIVPDLGKQAEALLRDLGYANIHVRIGDGFDGWPEEAPFDAIVVTAAPDEVPEPLLDQLAMGGRLVIPVGRGSQQLLRLTRTATGFSRDSVIPVRFVPMTGKAQGR